MPITDILKKSVLLAIHGIPPEWWSTEWTMALDKAQESITRKQLVSACVNITDLQRFIPVGSRDMVRIVLRDVKSTGHLECLGRGPGAKWRKRVLPVKKGNKEGNN